MTFQEFLYMGGYAFYVWTSFGVAAAVMVLNVLVPWLRLRRVRQSVRRAAYMRGEQA